MPPVPFPVLPPNAGLPVAACVLALEIGPPDAAPDPDLPGLVHLRLADLDAALLQRLRPLRVILPLVSPDHDAIQMILTLEALGYAGPLTVIAPPLPDAQMVQRELRALGPGARLTVLTP